MYTHEELINMLRVIVVRPSATFANIIYTKLKDESTVKYSVVINADTAVLYAKDMDILRALIPTLTENALMFEAASAILKSREESKAVGIGNHSNYSLAGHYDMIAGVKGLKQHKENKSLLWNILVQDETIITPGVPKKPVKSAPLTLAKAEISKQLPTSKFRSIRIDRIERLAMNGEVLELTAISEG